MDYARMFFKYKRIAKKQDEKYLHLLNKDFRTYILFIGLVIR